MSNFASAQNQHDAGVGGFTNEEHKRCRAFVIPGDENLSQGNEFLFGPKNPVAARFAKAWLADHSAKLASMVRAER